MTPAPNRRWLPLALLVVVVGIIGDLGWTVRRVNDRDRLLHLLSGRGVLMGQVESDTPAKRMPFLWTSFGARPVGVILLPEGEFADEEASEITTLFPEATIKQHTVRMDTPMMGIGRPP